MKKKSTLIFDDKMKLKDIILANKGFRLFLADCFGRYQLLPLTRAKSAISKKIEELNEYPLLETPVIVPQYDEFYRDKKYKTSKSPLGTVTSKSVPLKNMTPERKALSFELFLEGKKEDLGVLELTAEQKKYFTSEYERFQLNASNTDSYWIKSESKRSAFNFKTEPAIIPKPLLSYVARAGDEELANNQFEQIALNGRYFYGNTEGSNIFIPKIDVSLFEDSWNVPDSSWSTAINSLFTDYANLTIGEIKEYSDVSQFSLMKFRSFYEHLSNYKPQLNIIGTQPDSNLFHTESSVSTDEKPSAGKKTKPAPTKKEEKEKVISTTGIVQIIRGYTQDIIYSTGQYEHLIDYYKYKLSDDNKKIVFEIDLEIAKGKDIADSLKNKMVRDIQRKAWSSLFTMEIDLIGSLDFDIYFTLEASFTANQGYIFHPFGSKSGIDILTTDVRRKTIELPNFVSTYKEEELIPPAELPLNEKIKFILKFHPAYGTCQACLRHQALNADGTIHAHGYTFSNWMKSDNCYGSGKLPQELSKEATIFQISKLTQLLYKMNKYPNNYKEEELKEKNNIQFEISKLEKREKEWKFGYYDPSIRLWRGAKYPIDLNLNNEYIESEGAREVSEVILKLGNFKLIFISEINEKTLLLIKNDFERAIHIIKNSPLTKFKNVLRDRVFVGKYADLKKRGLADSSDAAASYEVDTGIIAFYTDPYRKKDSKERISDIVHEFGHKFHNEELPNFLKNQEMINLFKMTTKDSCIKDSLPVIGSLLSEYKVHFVVRYATEDDSVCIEIKGKRGEGAVYVFQNLETKQKQEISEDSLARTIVCPSNYAMKDVLEWFAEMCALVTGVATTRKGIQTIAKKFIETVNKM